MGIIRWECAYTYLVSFILYYLCVDYGISNAVLRSAQAIPVWEFPIRVHFGNSTVAPIPLPSQIALPVPPHGTLLYSSCSRTASRTASPGESSRAGKGAIKAVEKTPQDPLDLYSVIEEYLQNSNEPKFRELYRLAEKHDPPVSDEILEKIVEDDHLLIDWYSTLNVLMKNRYQETKECDFALGIDEFFMERVAYAFRLNNPWLGKFNKWIELIVEAGMIERWKQVYWPQDDECNLVKRGAESADTFVTVSDMQGSFYILFIGKSTQYLGQPANTLFRLRHLLPYHHRGVLDDGVEEGEAELAHQALRGIGLVCIKQHP